MAIYHYQRRIGKRASGKNAVFAAGYIRGEKKTCEKTGETKDFKGKENVIFKACLLPDDSPEWAKRIQQSKIKDKSGEYVYDTTNQNLSDYLWNQIELIEKRKDSQLYFHDDLSIPNELSKEQAIQLVKGFAQKEIAKNGLFCDVAVHWEKGNHHAHILRPLRTLTDTGFSKKIRFTQGELSSEVKDIRAAWSEHTNESLKLAGIDERVDHRSFKDRDIELMPTKKVGKAHYMSNSVQQEIRVSENQSIRAKNYQSIKENPEIIAKKLSQEHTLVTEQIVQDEVYKYVVNEDVLEQIKGEDDSKEKIIRNIINSIKEKESIFNEKFLKNEALKATNNSLEFTNVVHGILQSPEIIPLGLGEDGREHYTTQAAFDIELNLAASVKVLQKNKGRALFGSKLNNVAEKYTLNGGQKRALSHINNGSQLSIIIGYAGTGKTYTLKAANDVWQSSKLKVHGIALSGAAAAGLERDAGISSKTICGFLKSVRSGYLKLDKNSVIVMDEMGMTPLDDMNAVLSIVEEAGAKFVGVGDVEQTQPVGRGAPMRAIIEQAGCAVMDEVIRQQKQWQRNATVLMETQSTGTALDIYNDRGYVHLTDQDKVAEKVVERWQNRLFNEYKSKDLSHALRSVIMIAHQNDSVKQLNELARQRLKIGGHLNKETIFKSDAGDLSIAVGERLMFRKNDHKVGAGVKNGNFGTVESIENNHLTVKLDNGETVKFNSLEYNNIDYAYAATVHKLQGFTGDHSIAYIDGHGWDRHVFLVAASRHRLGMDVYASHENFTDYNKLKETISRRGLKDHILEFPATFAIRRGFEPDSVATKTVNFIRKARSKAYDNWLYIYNYQSYLDRQKAKASSSSKTSDKKAQTLKRRQDAVIVADFADNRVAIAKCIGSLDKLSPIQQEEIQADIYRLQLKNGKIALKITNSLEHYKTAIERNRLPLSAIEKSLIFIERHQKLKQAVDQITLGQFSNKVLANDVTVNIKSWWGHLLHQLPDKEQRNTFIQTLMPLAKEYQYEQALTAASTEQDKQNLKNAKLYIDLDLEISAQLKILKTMDGDAKKALQADISSLSANRDMLADTLTHDLSENQRWLDALYIDTERLLSHKDKYQDRQLVWQFAAMRPSTGVSPNYQRQLLANRLKGEPKRYGSFIFEQLIDGFKSINIENWNYQRALEVKASSSEFKASLRLIRRYYAASYAARDAWQKSFLKREKGSIHDKRYLQQAQGMSYQRDRIAAQIIANLEHHSAALSFDRVDIKKLSQRARHVNYLERYRKEKNIARALHMAKHISENLKSYGAGVSSYGLYHKVKEQAHRFHYLQNIKKEPSSAVREIIRLAEAYQVKRIESGRAWGQVKYAKAKNKSFLEQQAKKLTHQRNRAAYKLMRGCFKNNLVDPEIQGIKVNYSDANKASRQYIAYERILNYLNAKTPLRGEIANQILQDRSGFHFVYARGIDFKLLHAQSKAWLNGQEVPDKLVSSIASAARQNKVQTTPSKHWDIERINNTLMAAPEETYTKIFGAIKKRSGKELRFGEGLIVTSKGAQSGLWYSFSEGCGGSPIQALQHFGNLSFVDALAEGAKLAGLPEDEAKTSSFTSIRNVTPRSADDINKEQTERDLKLKTAKSIWAQSIPIEGTIAETYLSEHRNIHTVGHLNIRFLPKKSKWTEYDDNGMPIEKSNKLAAMIVAMQDKNGKVTAVQRTYLDEKTCNKPTYMENAKFSRGIAYGSAVILQKGSNGKVYIAEGVETASSIALADNQATILVSLSVSNMKNMVDIIKAHKPKEVIIAKDNDGADAASDKAIKDVLAKLNSEGLNTSAKQPDMLEGRQKTDWNDVAKAKGVSGLRDEIGIEKPEYDKAFIERLDNWVKYKDLIPDSAKNYEQTKLLTIYMDSEYEACRKLYSNYKKAKNEQEFDSLNSSAEMKALKNKATTNATILAKHEKGFLVAGNVHMSQRVAQLSGIESTNRIDVLQKEIDELESLKRSSKKIDPFSHIDKPIKKKGRSF